MSDKTAQLTQAETWTLRMVAEGYSDYQIADRHGLAERTVRTHVSHILHKLKLSSRTQAALYAYCNGIVSVDEAWEVVKSYQWSGWMANQ